MLCSFVDLIDGGNGNECDSVWESLLIFMVVFLPKNSLPFTTTLEVVWSKWKFVKYIICLGIRFRFLRVEILLRNYV